MTAQEAAALAAKAVAEAEAAIAEAEEAAREAEAAEADAEAAQAFAEAAMLTLRNKNATKLVTFFIDCHQIAVILLVEFTVLSFLLNSDLVE